MASNLYHAHTDTPTPGHAWSQLSAAGRQALVENTLASTIAFSNRILTIVDAKPDGQIIVNLLEPVVADKRGTLLLDLEAFLKESIDQGLVVWLEPFGDRSTLRNLRGIEVKS
jgi:hypothetical protein